MITTVNARPLDDETFDDVIEPRSGLTARIKSLKQFCTHKNKQPFNPQNGQPANNIAFGVSFDDAREALRAGKYDGIGVYLGNGLCGIDFDHCIVDGIVSQKVADIIRANPQILWLSSGSGTGVHGFFFGSKPGSVCKAGSAEIYDSKRYFRVEGQILNEDPSLISEGDVDASAIYEQIARGDFAKFDSKSDSKSEITTEPAAVALKQTVQIESSGTALTTKLELLLNGKIIPGSKPFVVEDDCGNSLSFPSQSEADLSLATLLAFETKGDAAELDRKFRESALMREKWNRADYRSNTIRRALDAFSKSEAVSVEAAKTQISSDQNVPPADWRSQFRPVGKLQRGGTRMLIEGFLPEGIAMLGALSGTGKTFFALSLCKALVTGKPFLGRFAVPEIVPVLYLVPELSGGSFRARCEKFGIPDDENLFLCRTISEGVTLAMDDPAVISAVRELRPFVVLDTCVRFNKSTDENSASANKIFVDEALALRAVGARGVLGIHHAKKSIRKDGFYLETALRGTGDLGAMAQCVYGLRRDDDLYDDGNGPLMLEVRCLKPPDFTPPLPFTIAATVKKGDEVVSAIDTTGDFILIERGVEAQELSSQFVRVIDEHPSYSLARVAEALGISKRKVQGIADKLKVRKTRAGWIFANVKTGISSDPITSEEIAV